MRTKTRTRGLWAMGLVAAAMIGAGGLSGCGAPSQEGDEKPVAQSSAQTDASDSEAMVNEEVAEVANTYEPEVNDVVGAGASDAGTTDPSPEGSPTPSFDELAAKHGLNITQDLRPSLSHGPKGAEYQKYIVIHDTEGLGDPQNVVDWWDSNGNLVGAHYVIGQDGTIVQAVPLDEIAHHAGYGDAGHNELYGVSDESRDDKLGSTPIGEWAPDYGMNSYSVGIELVHLGSTGEDYPPEQLEALDALIAFIDEYYGSQSQIIDHKAWRSGNSDTSAEFDQYMVNYQATRTHDGS